MSTFLLLQNQVYISASLRLLAPRRKKNLPDEGWISFDFDRVFFEPCHHELIARRGKKFYFFNVS